MVSSLVIGAICVGLFAAPSFGQRYFTIRVKGKLIGYATIDDSTGANVNDVVEQTSKTELKISLLGKVQHVRISATTMVDRKTGRARSLKLRTQANDLIRRFDVQIEGETAKIWSFAEGEPRGEPKSVAVPEPIVLLGSNVFGHWELLIKAANRRAAADRSTLAVLFPESGRVGQMPWAAIGIEEVVVNGAARKVKVWSVQGGAITVWSDPKTGQLLKLDIPAQQTVIESAGQRVVKLFEKAEAEEVLADRFAQSNVRFDDFLKVRKLKVRLEAQLAGTGATSDAAVFKTAMQSFEGTKDGPRVSGVFHVRTVRYDRADSPRLGADVPADLAPWTRPSEYIESDDARVVDQAKKLTAGAHTRWDAVRKVGQWVYEEIRYTIAESPSACRALEKKEGDCGPHATLMIAMLRSVGVPARLVGGLVYTPSFGGSFGQHAWVEVHMGPAGWLAVDPTTGEFEQLSATHIKLFEGLGAVTAEKIEVLEYDPPNRTADRFVPKTIRPVPWENGKKYTYRYLLKGKEIGRETFVIQRTEREGTKGFTLEDTLHLGLKPSTTLDSTTRLAVSPKMRPVDFDRRTTEPREMRVHCRFSQKSVQEKVSGTRSLEKTIEIPNDVYCFDNNLIASFALICTQLELEVGRALRIEAFHPSSLQVLGIKFTPTEEETIQVGGKAVKCFRCTVDPIGNTFWITADGRLVRVAAGELAIEIDRLEP